MTDKQPKTTYHLHRRGTKTRWLWLPSLMFGDGVAVSVLVLTMVMLRRMGLDTADTALAIALLSLPVLLRPLFEMVVTHFWGTTKVWILSTQFISALSLAAVAFTLHTSSWLLGTVCFMPFFVCSSVFYNIALHRFYIDTSQGLHLSQGAHLSQVHQQNPTPQQDTMVRWCDGEMVKCVCNDTPSHPNDSQLPTNLTTSPSHPLTILIGLQPKRDFMKGALKIATFVEEVARRHPGKVQIKYVEGVPYDEYMRLLAEADVLVDQLYSYTPSMNSLAAMARGTVVIGGGEEEYYEFIGEDTLRPIINVRPDVPDEENIATIERALFTDGTLERMAQESIQFVHKYHDYRHVAEQYEQLYRSLLAKG